MTSKPIFFITLIGILSACSQLADSRPTAFPPDYLPTAVALTGQAAFATSAELTAGAPATETSLPTETPIPSTPLPTASPTFAPGFTQFAQIRFLSPGPMSSLVSPINFQVMLVSGESGIVQLDLLGEDGRLLQRGFDRVQRNRSGNYRSFDMSFEIRAVSEKGYIRISSKDDRRRIQVLNTMPVLLYSVGQSQINPVGNMIYERCMLEGLADGDEVVGGVLNLSGSFWPFNEQPVFVELLLPEGRPIAARVLDFDGIEPQAFETTLPYKVTEPTLARLSFHQDNPELTVSDPELKRYVYVYTMEVLLKP